VLNLVIQSIAIIVAIDFKICKKFAKGVEVSCFDREGKGRIMAISMRCWFLPGMALAVAGLFPQIAGAQQNKAPEAAHPRVGKIVVTEQRLSKKLQATVREPKDGSGTTLSLIATFRWRSGCQPVILG
jgi:hypothetical protein